MARPLPGLPMLRVNAEIPKLVATGQKRSFVVKFAGPPPDVQDVAERAHQVAK